MSKKKPSAASSRSDTPMFTKLQSYVGVERMLHLTTHLSCQPVLYGFLMGLSQKLGLLHNFNEFWPDGYIVFRVSDVMSLRSNKYERQFEKIVKGEGLLDGLNRTLKIDLENFKSAINSVHERFEWMIIEAENEARSIDDFYIGKLASLSSSTAQFHHFDATGKWDSEPAAISLKDIAIIQFDSPYLNTFRKYLSGQID